MIEMNTSYIWKVDPDLDQLNAFSANTMVEHCGIKFTEFGPDFLKATMPVTERTIQPYGILHGGANVVLAETVGSVAAVLCIDQANEKAVGLEVNANHLKAVKKGHVTGVAKPIRLGKTTQVWEVKMYDDEENLTCIARLTMAVIPKNRI